MEFSISQKGKEILLYVGYRYRKIYTALNGNITWRCLSTSCKGRIKTYNNDIISQSEHNHVPNPESNAAYLVSSTIRVQAIVTNDNPRAIYQEVTSGIPLSVALHMSSFSNTQRRIKYN